MIRRWLEKYDRLLSPKYRRGRKLWRHSRAEGRAQSADQAGRRRARADPGLAGARLPRLVGIEPAAICRAAADHGGGGARGEGAGHAQGSRRCRALCPRRVSRRSRQGSGRYRGHQPHGRQGRGSDRHRCRGTRRLAGRFSVGEFRREFDRKNGKVTGRYDASGDGLRSLSGFELRAVRRSLRRLADARR